MVSQSIGPRIYSAINRHLVDTDSPDFAEGSDFDFEYDEWVERSFFVDKQGSRWPVRSKQRVSISKIIYIGAKQQ